MTLRNSDLQSVSDLDSIRNSCDVCSGSRDRWRGSESIIMYIFRFRRAEVAAKMEETSKKKLELITAMITAKKGLITKTKMTIMKRKSQINPRRDIMIFTMI